MKLNVDKTYDKFSQPEIADFDMEAIIYKDVVTLDISVHNAQVVHVLEHDGGISCNSNSIFHV